MPSASGAGGVGPLPATQAPERAPAAVHLFVYWRCQAADAAAAQAAARRLQARLCAEHPGLQARLFLRADATASAPGEVTLMETYAPDDGAADMQLALRAAWPLLVDSVRAASAELQPWLSSARHVETFQPLP